MEITLLKLTDFIIFRCNKILLFDKYIWVYLQVQKYWEV